MGWKDLCSWSDPFENINTNLQFTFFETRLTSQTNQSTTQNSERLNFYQCIFIIKSVWKTYFLDETRSGKNGILLATFYQMDFKFRHNTDEIMALPKVLLTIKIQVLFVFKTYKELEDVYIRKKFFSNNCS